MTLRRLMARALGFPAVRAIRGAITVPTDDADAIREAVIELLDAVRRICYELPVVGMDVVEVSPPFDHADITALLGNRVVLEALTAMARRRKDDRDGTRWDPGQPLLDGR